MPVCFFASDLHGRPDRYEKLIEATARERPAALFLGGDLLPHATTAPDFLSGYLVPRLRRLRSALGAAYPRVFVILGNDDARSEETVVLEAAERGVWEYAHGRRIPWGNLGVWGRPSLCCTRNPRKTRAVPSSMRTGIAKWHSRKGARSRSRVAWSRSKIPAT